MPDIRIYKNLPANARLMDELGGGTLQHIANSVQPPFDDIRRRIVNSSQLFTPELTDDAFLDFLGQSVGLGPLEGNRWIGVGINPDWPRDAKQRLLERAWVFWQIKGTEIGFREAVRLWLLWSGHNRERLIISLPFGKAPTANPPKWWSYQTLFDSDRLSTWAERKQLGSGDYLHPYTPTWVQLRGNFIWQYGQSFQQTILHQVEHTESLQRSFLGPRTPWRQFYLEAEAEWHQIFPDVFDLSIEVSSANATPLHFGWLLSPPTFPKIPLKSDPETAKPKIIQKLAVDGFQYGDRFPGAVSEDREEVREVEISYSYGNWPGFQYGHPMGGTAGQATYQWYAPYKARTRIESRTEIIPGQSCMPGVDVRVAVAQETVTVVDRPAVPANQYVEYREGETSTVTRPGYAGVWPGFQYGQVFPIIGGNDPPPIDTTELEAIDVEDFAISTGAIGEIDTFEAYEFSVGSIESGFAEDSIQIYSPARPAEIVTTQQEPGYYFSKPIGIFTYYTPMNGGHPLYFAGSPQIEHTEERPIFETVRLCNTVALFSRRIVTLISETIINPGEGERPWHQVYPDLASIQEAANWTLTLDSNGLILLKPKTIFWSSEPTASKLPEFEQRSLSFSPEKFKNLYLEFVIQPQKAMKVSGLSLIQSSVMLHHRQFERQLNLDERGCYGFRYVIPFAPEEIDQM